MVREMTREQIEKEAIRFRQAMVLAREAGEFKPKRFKYECMDSFPYDCCE